MTEVWDTFDGLFRTVQRQERRIVSLEEKVIELERRLEERAAMKEPHAVVASLERSAERKNLHEVSNELPAERAA